MENEAVDRLSKQIKSLKTMLSIFLVMVVANLLVLGFIAWTVISFTRDITHKVAAIETSTSQSLDFKTKICDNSTLSRFLDSNSDLCKK